MNCTECKISLPSQEEFQEHIAKYHLMGIMINTSKGSNKMFTRTVYGNFSCPTCFGTCENINEILNHLFCSAKPPKLSDSGNTCASLSDPVFEEQLIKPLTKEVEPFFPVESSPPPTNLSIPPKSEMESLHYHFIPVDTESITTPKDQKPILKKWQSKLYIKKPTLCNTACDLFTAIVLKYVKSVKCTNTMFGRIEVIPEGSYLLWSQLLFCLGSGRRPKQEDSKKMLKELEEAGILVCTYLSQTSVAVEKGPKFFIKQ